MYTIGKKKLSDQELKQIKKDWLLILETILFLKQNISDALLDYKRLPECLYLGQKLSNEFDYFVKLHGVPNKVVDKKEFTTRKAEASELYKKLYDIFDEITINEIIKYIRVFLDDSFEQYKMYIENMKVNPKKDVIKMMEERNKMDYLYKEMEIWLGKSQGENAKASKVDIHAKQYQDILSYDHLLEEYIGKKGRKNYTYLIEEARQRLVPEPDGSERFDFWWWYISKAKDINKEKTNKNG
jgi:hypothetical protein